MRHFTLMKLLTVSSFAVSPDKPTSSSRNALQQTSPAQFATVVSETAQQAAIDSTDNGRRMALYSLLFTSTSAAFFVVPKSAKALDMDAFVNSEVCSLFACLLSRSATTVFYSFVQPVSNQRYFFASSMVPIHPPGT
jgi:hypothetical protein